MKLRHRVEYAAGRCALLVVNLLPERLAYAACGALGRLYFRCSRRRQRIALRVLGNAFPDASEAERLRLARVATGNVFKVVLDTVRVIPLLEKGRLLERVDTSEFRAKAPPPPFLGLTAHHGSWEIAAIVSGLLFGEAHGVARVFKNPLLQAFILRNRRRAGLHIHPRRGGVRDLARALQRGCVGLQVVDQNQRLRGVFAPFFGELASTERAAATLAVRHGYPIVVGSALRAGPGLRFRMRISEPFRPTATGDREKDVERAVCEVNRRLEDHILAAPEQYLWIHDRYRTRPPPETPTATA
jgi:KDO2-lipid IV(A) lauroyltransferase